jgi:hypothetical protein
MAGDSQCYPTLVNPHHGDAHIVVRGEFKR